MARRGARKPTAQKTTGGFLTSALRPPPKVSKRSGFKEPKDWAMSGMWVGTISSTVAGLMYDYEEESLFVHFRGGSVYKYTGVPIRVASDMFCSSSIGKYLDRVIKKRGYPFAEVRHVTPRYRKWTGQKIESGTGNTSQRTSNSSDGLYSK